MRQGLPHLFKKNTAKTNKNAVLAYMAQALQQLAKQNNARDLPRSKRP
jgi:hypothetical protein